MAVAAQSVSDMCRVAKVPARSLARVAAMAQGVREIVALSDPVGELLDGGEGEGQVRF
jgi:gamma-glutamyl phosphate reductase